MIILLGSYGSRLSAGIVVIGFYKFICLLPSLFYGSDYCSSSIVVLSKLVAGSLSGFPIAIIIPSVLLGTLLIKIILLYDVLRSILGLLYIRSASIFCSLSLLLDGSP